MADNLKGIPFSTEDEGKPFPEVAKQIVSEHTDGNVYVVWFAYVLGNWKALCSTDLPDGRYFEVTYPKGSPVAFLDTYVKASNDEVPLPRPTPIPVPVPPVLEPEPVPTPVPTPPPSEDLPGWALQYSTKFKDLAGWTVYNNQTQSNDNSVNMAKNVVPGPNGLNILGKRESGFAKPFTSGEIVSHHKDVVVGNYFRAEVTGTFEDATGVWPCLLWFRPDNANDGEIDVMEWMGGLWSGDQKRVAITMHNEYGDTQDSAKKPLILKNNTWFDPSKEHTYTVEKVPGSITVWVDGRKISTFTAKDKGWWNRIMEVKDRTWYPRITLQIGQGTKKVVPNPDASFKSTTVKVSSFKIWRQA